MDELVPDAKQLLQKDSSISFLLLLFFNLGTPPLDKINTQYHFFSFVILYKKCTTNTLSYTGWWTSLGDLPRLLKMQLAVERSVPQFSYCFWAESMHPLPECFHLQVVGIHSVIAVSWRRKHLLLFFTSALSTSSHIPKCLRLLLSCLSFLSCLLRFSFTEHFSNNFSKDVQFKYWYSHLYWNIWSK